MPQDNNKKAPGRPSKYTPEIVEEILNRLEDGETLIEICRDEHMPAARTVRSWKKTKKEEFLPLYASAREEQQHTFSDMIKLISFDDSRDYQPVTTTRFLKDGTKIEVTEMRSDNTATQRDRLKVDTLKFLMARLASATYGDKVEQQITGKDGKELSIVVNIGPKGNNT